MFLYEIFLESYLNVSTILYDINPVFFLAVNFSDLLPMMIRPVALQRPHFARELIPESSLSSCLPTIHHPMYDHDSNEMTETDEKDGSGRKMFCLTTTGKTLLLTVALVSRYSFEAKRFVRFSEHFSSAYMKRGSDSFHLPIKIIPVPLHLWHFVTLVTPLRFTG